MKPTKESLFDYGWIPSWLMLLDEADCGHRVAPCPSLDDLDADHSHTGGSSYYLSRKRKPARKP